MSLHLCRDMPDADVSITNTYDSWDLSVYLRGDSLGPTETDMRLSITHIKHCPWCGQRLDENTLIDPEGECDD